MVWAVTKKPLVLTSSLFVKRVLWRKVFFFVGRSRSYLWQCSTGELTLLQSVESSTSKCVCVGVAEGNLQIQKPLFSRRKPAKNTGMSDSQIWRQGDTGVKRCSVKFSVLLSLLNCSSGCVWLLSLTMSSLVAQKQLHISIAHTYPLSVSSSFWKSF